MELACAQLAHGHEVRVVTLDRLFNANTQERLASSETVRGIDVIRIPYRGSTRYPIAPSVLGFIKSADIVHVHAIDFFFDYLAWTKPFHRKPIIASTHGAFFHTSFAQVLKRIYFNVITRLSAAWYDGIVAVSSADQDLFSKINSNVVCIENGVNIARFSWRIGASPEKVHHLDRALFDQQAIGQIDFFCIKIAITRSRLDLGDRGPPRGSGSR